MRSFLLRNHDLEGTSEITDGIAVLRVHYRQALISRSHGFILIRKLLKKLYKKSTKNVADNVSCAVVVEADAESDDLALIRAVMSLWDIVTRKGGRLVLIGYPILRVSGERTHLPPMMPNFGL